RHARLDGTGREGARGVDPRMVEDRRAMDGHEGRQTRRRARGRHGAATRRGRRAQAAAGGSRRATRLHRAPAREGARPPTARAAALTGMEDILALILIFGGGACIAMAFSPIGRAVADRIRGKSASAGGGDVRTEFAEHKAALDQELEAVRRELAELAERMDFAERLLAKNREGQRIGPSQ